MLVRTAIEYPERLSVTLSFTPGDEAAAVEMQENIRNKSQHVVETTDLIAASVSIFGTPTNVGPVTVTFDSATFEAVGAEAIEAGVTTQLRVVPQPGSAVRIVRQE